VARPGTMILDCTRYGLPTVLAGNVSKNPTEGGDGRTRAMSRHTQNLRSVADFNAPYQQHSPSLISVLLAFGSIPRFADRMSAVLYQSIFRPPDWLGQHVSSIPLSLPT
jgi:hypothetical protein